MLELLLVKMSSSHSSGSSSGGRGMLCSPHLYPPPPSAMTPKSLLKHCKLPTAAYLHTPTAPAGLDLSRPLLLYSSYTSTKVRGVSLRPGRDSSLSPIGPAIVIPESYTGWFAIVTSDGHTAPFFSTIEQVAKSQVAFFLTRYDVAGYTNLQEENGRKTYQKVIIQSGHVLKLLGIFEDVNVKKTNSGGRGKDAMASATCTKYAQCLNYRNEVVFLPFSTSGRFYTTAHKNSKNPNHVYLMAHILKNYRLPITVRLVCGYMPRVPCSFTGVLRLERAQKEAVILACTMTNEARATLFEIDVSSNFVLTPVKDTMFPKTPIYLKTVSYCEDEADAWRRQIKVTHHVTEKRSRSSNRSFHDSWMESPESMSFAFLVEHDKKKGRSRDKSRDRLNGIRIHERRRDRSKDNILRDPSRDKLSEKPQNKPGEKGQDSRKVTKQNTYIFQKDRNVKLPDKKQEANAISRLNKSIENQDYSRVVDDISPVQENGEEEEEEHYAEICEYIIGKNAHSGRHESKHNRQRQFYYKENDTSSFDDDKNLSFTLLKKDIGGYYVKIPGFEVPRADVDNGIYSDKERTYDSSC